MNSRYLPDHIETPCVVIDVDIVDRNIRRAQDYLDEHGVMSRPHIKTHKLPKFAHRQIEAGAIGITCQKIGEAEVMADAGIGDILITYNIVGTAKLQRLRRLAQTCRLTVVADSEQVVRGLSETFATAAVELSVLVECDTGQQRCGVQTSEQAAHLATFIDAAPGLLFDGFMTYPPKKSHERVNQFLQRAVELCESNKLEVNTVSNGGTPDMQNSHLVSCATEHRSGTYIYNDRSLVESGDCKLADCALAVHATVVSRPTDDRMIIDAGSKVLTSDPMGLTGFGHVVEYPKAAIRELHEEHGIVDLSNCVGTLPNIGDIVQIIPNHACVVSNLFDRVFLRHGDGRIEIQDVACRGQVW
ncbi:MAG: D-TA family PLP-dependent enzyme [Rhizobiaceae bacterium]|nr:D-TA family PLP-dependent enzyme [Rhizobiaceae bacterium]